MAAFGAEKWTEAIASFKEGLDQRALLGGSSEQLDILEEVGVLASCPCACPHCGVGMTAGFGGVATVCKQV